MKDSKNYFDHDADIGIIGYGDTLESCFCDAAEAIFALMVESQVEQIDCVEFEFTENDVELAFVTWINLLLAKSQAKNLILAKFQLKRDDDVWHTRAYGEKWRPGIERGIDVKGATLSMLSVKKENSHWKVTCIVDV